MQFKSPFLVSIAGRLASVTLRVIFRTLRHELHTASVNPYGCTGDNRYLFSVWHDSAIMAAFGGRHNRTVALTSRHRDGTFVEAVIAGVKVKAVRGSSGRSGTRAARELLKVSKQKDIVITPDGPRGPRRTMSRGTIYLASKTGNSIVPTAFACSRAWDIAGSWTSLTIPKPFSRLVLLAGEPIHVPPDLTPSEIDEYIALVQQKMDELQPCAAAELANPTSAPRVSIRTKLNRAA